MHGVSSRKCSVFIVVVVEDGLPPIAAASMWTRKDIKEFKESLKKDKDSVIKVGSGETVTVSAFCAVCIVVSLLLLGGYCHGDADGDESFILCYSYGTNFEVWQQRLDRRDQI